MIFALRTLIAVFAPVVFITGCETNSDLAPLPAPTASSVSTLEGRRIYLTCAGSCHSPEPVLKYSRAEWFGKHIPEMSREARLRPEQIAALEAYVGAMCPR